MKQEKAYVSFMERFMRGEAPSEQEFLFHFEHQNGAPEHALAPGARAPDLALPDQAGAMRTLRSLAGAKGLLLVFARSAYWCPYCRNQLAELNVQLNKVRDSGFNVVAITSDVVQRIQAFSLEHAIGYPILSDTQGAAINAFGVLNDKIPPNGLQGSAPLPHPGHFLLSPDMTVLAREFTGDLRHRPSATVLIAETSETVDGGANISAETVKAHIALSATHAYGGQELAVTAKLEIADGAHVYAPDVQAPYTPVSITFENDEGLLAAQSFAFPIGEKLPLEALNDSLPVLSGRVVGHGRIRLRWSPPRSPFAQLADFVASQAIRPGRYDLRGALHFQACTSTECLPPTTLAFSLPLEVLPHAKAGEPVKWGDFEIPPPTE